LKRSRGTASKEDTAKFVKCSAILTKLMTHEHAWPFNVPVDPVALNLPDYSTIIKEPMDFGTIKKTLKAKNYTSVDEFVDEVELVFANCLNYNGEQSDIGKWAIELRALFRQLFADIDKEEFDLHDSPPAKRAKETKKTAPAKKEKSKEKLVKEKKEKEKPAKEKKRERKDNKKERQAPTRYSTSRNSRRINIHWRSTC